MLDNRSPVSELRYASEPMADTRRLRALDGLRGLAALGVVAYHYFDRPAYYGLLGVELFFVISGFVILMTLERARSLGEFAVRRAARLYPAYWISVVVAGSFLWATHQTTAEAVLINATMLQAFLYWPNIITPYWTLAYELVFYAAVASLFAANQLRNIERVALAWLAAMILFKSSILLSGRGWGLYNDWLLQSLLMPQFGHLFIAGMMLYRIDIGRGTLLTYVVLGFSVLYSLFGRPDWAQIGPVPYFLANGGFIAAVWAASSGRAQVFAVPWLVGIGTCSYSLYLLHLPVKLIFGYFSGQLMGHCWFLVLVVFPTTIGLCLLVQTYVERPVQLWAKGWVARARSVRGTVW